MLTIAKDSFNHRAAPRSARGAHMLVKRVGAAKVSKTTTNPTLAQEQQALQRTARLGACRRIESRGSVRGEGSPWAQIWTEQSSQLINPKRHRVFPLKCERRRRQRLQQRSVVLNTRIRPH